MILLSLQANDNIDNNNKHQTTKLNHGLRRVFPYLEYLRVGEMSHQFVLSTSIKIC